MRDKRVLIIGGGGFIGSALARRLCNANQVTIADKSPYEATALCARRLPMDHIRYVQCDASRPEMAAALGHDFDYIIHACAVLGIRTVVSQSIHTILTNTASCQIALELASAQEHLSKFVLLSSSEVYGIHTEQPDESAPAVIGPPTEGRWCYAASKTLSEHLAFAYHRERGLPLVVIRPFNVFGEYRAGSNAITAFLERAMRGEELVIDGDGQQIRAWCYIDDFVDGVVRALESPYTEEIFNLGNPGNTISISGLAELILTLTGSASTVRVTHSTEPDVRFRSVNIDKARRLLGYEPGVSLEDGLRRLYQWRKNQGP